MTTESTDNRSQTHTNTEENMKENTHTEEAEIRRIVEEVVEEKLGEQSQSVPFTRREIIGGLAILGGGASLGTLGAVGRASASEGSGSIGTASNPLAEIYVDELFHNTSWISEEGNRLWLQETEPSEAEDGDYWIE